MKLTLETKDKTVVIELPHDEQTVTSIFDELLIPAVLAFGYEKENFNDYISESAMLLDDNGSEDILDIEEDWGLDND